MWEDEEKDEQKKENIKVANYGLNFYNLVSRNW